MEVKELLKLKTWVVVGASENKEKYGCKIFKRLKNLGYNVMPVNPNYENIFGEKCYPNLMSLPQKPDVINLVVSPKHGMKTIEEASALGIKYVWLQPGTFNDELLDFAKEKGIETIQACVLVET
ncbi:MAG: CoA-binding protein [Deltaproteobacteria bacterium]